jgi:hypothetical protein
MPQSKYDKQSGCYRSYSKKRKRSQTETRIFKRSLLYLLGKLIGLLEETIRSNSSRLSMLSIINKAIVSKGKKSKD